MKSIITFLIIIALGYADLAHCQYLVNAGSDIVINSGTSLVMDASFRNESDGSMNNSGQVLISGDWINNQTSGNLLNGTSGVVEFTGSTPQDIGGSAITYFHDLDLQNDANLTANAISVNGNLTLSSTFLSLGNGVVVIQSSGQIVGAGPSGYIIAGGNGMLRQYVTGANKIFPVGTISSFVPVTLSNTGTADYYSVRVFPDVRTNGTTGGTIPEINDCVDMTWVITENVAGGSNLSVTPYWSAGLEGPNFNRNHAAVGHYTAGAWDPDGEGIASGANPYSITRTGITSLSAFAVGDLESPMAIPIDIRLDVTAFLEGPFNGSGMDTDLLSGGVIPLLQPYNTAPWFYGGSESVGSIPADVVDWCLLEIRDAANAASATPATVVATKAVFLLSDGSIVDIDGSSLPAFSFTLTNQMFAVVWHRNHLGIMSASALSESGGIYSYDFTTSGQAYLNGQKNLGGGDYGMYSGNGNGNLLINLMDKNNVWAPEAGTTGYKDGDFDMNTEVDNADKNDQWYNNTGTSSTVPN
ncbi:MAG: hypothetical protein KDC05_02080 [Bacteroidales bacterium]|nr:hypothetical protein [Bacteroidales bacterium]